MKLDEVFNSPKGIRWLSQGRYQYAHNGNVIEINEPWRKGITFKGETVIQSYRYAKMAGSMLKVESIVDRQGNNQTTVEFECDDLHKVITKIEGNTKQWRWQKSQVNGEVLAQGELAEGLLFPLLRVFEGELIEALEQHPRNLILPDIRLSAKPGQKLSLYAESRYSYRIKPMSEHAGFHFRFIGGEYDEHNSHFVVKDDLLQYYQWKTEVMGTWQVTLDWKKL